MSLSLYLSIALISWCRRYIGVWVNHAQRRTHSPVIATENENDRHSSYSSMIVRGYLSHGYRSIELSELPPYPGTPPPSYPGSTAEVDIVDTSPGYWSDFDFQYDPAINISQTGGPQINDGTGYRSQARTTLTNYGTSIPTISPSPSIEITAEISVPPTPQIFPVQLPPVLNEVYIADLRLDTGGTSIVTASPDVRGPSPADNTDPIPTAALERHVRGTASPTVTARISTRSADIQDSRSSGF